MADITYDEWIQQTKKSIFNKRSAELVEVDKAFKAYADGGGQGSTLLNLSRAFKLWVDLKKADGIPIQSRRNSKKDESGVGPVDRLQSLIRTAKASDVGIRRDLQGSIPDRLVMDLTLRNQPMDREKVKETYKQGGLAVHSARDLMLRANNDGTDGRLLYTRWFGAYDAQRHETVVSNFKGLCDLFDIGVITIHDARAQMDAWGACFGFAIPGKQQNYVEFTVGRAFFSKTGYNRVPGRTMEQRKQAVIAALADAYDHTSDWTVGTMVHELGHARNALPDVDFQEPSTYRVSPGGLTPGDWVQCSTPALDLALALARPDLAVLNTDNYGQCSQEALAVSGH